MYNSAVLEEIDRAVAGAHARLRTTGLVTPVERSGDDERLWMDCELASLAELRLGERRDPRGLDEATRERWRATVTEEGAPASLRARAALDVCYWLVEDGARIGTIAVARISLGGDLVRVASLYLFPERRGRGSGRRALEAVVDALGSVGLGLSLDTSWTWPATVRFYLHLGMWVRMWKRELMFSWEAGLPTPRISVSPSDAVLDVELDGECHGLAHARRDGDRLVEFEFARTHADPRVKAVCWHAPSTLALALALAGWPLVQSPEHWERHRHSDAVTPESLAQRITIWEALARHRGWRVETPRIAGLDYPTWAEFQRRWRSS